MGDTTGMDDDAAAKVGAWITEARSQRGMSQKRLAAEADCAVSTLSMIENGQHGPRGWNLTTLRSIEDALDVPFGTLQRVASGESVTLAQLDDTPELEEILEIVRSLSEKVEQRDGELARRLDALDERVRSLGG